MSHKTTVTFQKGHAIVRRGTKGKIVSIETGHSILQGETNISFSGDSPEPKSNKRSERKLSPQRTAIERARLALGLATDDKRVAACPDGPCRKCKNTGIVYVA